MSFIYLSTQTLGLIIHTNAARTVTDCTNLILPGVLLLSVSSSKSLLQAEEGGDTSSCAWVPGCWTRCILLWCNVYKHLHTVYFLCYLSAWNGKK